MVRTDAQEFFDMGSKFHEQGSFDDALIYYQKALDYLKNSDDAKTEGNILLEVGNRSTCPQTLTHRQQIVRKTSSLVKRKLYQSINYLGVINEWINVSQPVASFAGLLVGFFIT